MDAWEHWSNIATRSHTDVQFRNSLDLNSYFEAARKCSKGDIPLTKGTLRIAILGYVVEKMAPWDPANVLTGLPGSEECVVYGANELVRRGHSVTVYMNPPPQSVWRAPFSNPQWLPVSVWSMSQNTEHYDVVLMWRRLDFSVGYERSPVVLYWPHDSPPVPPWGKKFGFPMCDGVCILSKHHLRQYQSSFTGMESIPYVVSGNGYLPEHFIGPNVATNIHSMGYFSNYARGLILLMMMWPRIRARFPTATLDICYGRETWGSMNEGQFAFVINRITEYKNQGVTEHGLVGHETLAHIMQRTSVWTYPCPAMGACETFCITAVKCQAAGMIPVTTRVGALNETVHPEAPSIPGINVNADIEAYYNLLCKVLDNVANENREKYQRYATQFTWTHTVDQWLALYHKVTQ